MKHKATKFLVMSCLYGSQVMMFLIFLGIYFQGKVIAIEPNRMILFSEIAMSIFALTYGAVILLQQVSKAAAKNI